MSHRLTVGKQLNKQTTVTQLPRFVTGTNDTLATPRVESHRFNQEESSSADHPAVKATAIWACLGIDDASDDITNDDTLAGMTPLESPRDRASMISGDSDAEDVSEVRDADSAADTVPAHATVAVIDDALIAELETALVAEATYWSSKYKLDPQGTADEHQRHDPAFKQAIDDYVLGLEHLHLDVRQGKLTVAGLLERSNQLGTMWLRAVGLADANGFTETTRLCMQDAADAYALPSVTANEYNIGAGLVRGALLAGVNVGCAITGVAAPLLPLYIASGINFTYVAVQLGFSVMLPLQNAAAQSGAVKRQAQWGPLFNPSLESSKCVKPAGGEHKLRTLAKVQAEFDELAKVNALYGQPTCDPAAAVEARHKAAHRQKKYLHRLGKRMASLRKDLQQAQDNGQDIGDAGRKVLGTADTLLALAAAQGLKGTIHQPSPDWYARTEALRRQHDLYTLVVAQLDHVLTLSILDHATAINDEGLASVDRDTLNIVLKEAPEVLTPRVTQILDRATTVSDEGKPHFNPQTLATVLKQTPAPITARLAELTWELATTDRYETLNVLTHQGHSRAARNALNLLAALFSLVGNAEDMANVEQETQELIAGIARAAADVVAESATSFFGEVFDATLGPVADFMRSMRDLVSMTSVQTILEMSEASKWEILSWLTLLAQPRIYAMTQPRGTRRDMENKLATQAQIAALTNHGSIVNDGKLDPAGLDRVMKGSMKVRMEHFRKTLVFDSKVYQNALWALLADKDHVTASSAVKVDIPDPGDPSRTLGVSCTCLGLSAVFERFKKPEQANERAALIQALGAARGLTPADMQSLGTILALYEQNLINIDHAGKNNLQALLGPGSTLPESSQAVLACSLRHAQAPKHLPTTDPRHAGVQAYLDSDLGQEDAKQDDRLAERFGQTERRNNTGNINQSAQKMGQSYAKVIGGSGGPTTIKAIATGVSEGLRMAGGYVDPVLNTAAIGVKLAGNVVSIVGSTMGIFLGYAFHKFILQKNLDRARDVELKVPSMANASVLSIEDRDFMTLLSLDRLRGRVTQHDTLLATPIPAATLPAPLQDFKQFVLQLLPAFLGHAPAAPDAPTLPPLPALRYESKTTFVQDILVQMQAATLRDMFTAWATPHGELAEMSEQDIEAIVKEAAAAIYDAAQRQASLQDDEEGVSGEEGDDEDVGEQQIDSTADEPVRQPVPPLDPRDAIELATRFDLWRDEHMDDKERDQRVDSLVGFVQRNPARRNEVLQAMRDIESVFGSVLADGHERPEGLVMAIQQSHDLVNQVIRRLGPDPAQRPPVLDVQ